MAKKISDLTNKAVLAGTEQLEINDAGTSKRATAAAIAALALFSGDAEDVDYDNGASGLAATDVQAAIDELAASLGSGGEELRGLTFTSDTGSTADSDPGNGLFKWNNATQASATVLYFDDLTSDGASTTTYFGGLPATGYVYIVQGDDSTRWQLWKWTANTDASGYTKLTATFQSSSGNAIVDNKVCYCDFDADANTGGASTQGKHAIAVYAGGMVPRAVGGCADFARVAAATLGRPDMHSVDFDATSIENAQFSIVMPKKWNEGTVTAKFYWSHAATTTNFGVRWGIRAAGFSDDDAINLPFGTAIEVTDTGGTTDDLYISAETSAITIAGTLSAEDLAVFEVFRDPTNGADTMAIDARLHAVVIYVTTDAETDA